MRLPHLGNCVIGQCQDQIWDQANRRPPYDNVTSPPLLWAMWRWRVLLTWIYHNSSLKWGCVGCRHHITKLTRSHQSRRDAESCHIFFCLKLLIFDAAKLVQMWLCMARKIQAHMGTKMADAFWVVIVTR